MQTITPNQLRCARIFLGWTQRKLCTQLGVSIPTFAKWETDGNYIPESKIPLIKEIFDNHDIEFIEDKGVFKRSSETKSYSGHQGLKTVFDNMYTELEQNKDLEVCAMGVNESQFLKRLDFAEAHVSRMSSLKPRMRILKASPTSKNLQSYAEYRVTDPVYFHSAPVYIYGHKVILLSWGPLEAIVIENIAQYRSFKGIFEHLWSNAKERMDSSLKA